MFTLLDEAAGAAGKAQNPLGTVIMMVAIFAVFYFFMIRPQNKKRKELEQYRSNIAKGDDVVTIGGIHGKVVSVNDTTVLVAVEDGTKLRIEKSAISKDSSSQLTPETVKQAEVAAK